MVGLRLMGIRVKSHFIVKNRDGLCHQPTRPGHIWWFPGSSECYIEFHYYYHLDHSCGHGIFHPTPSILADCYSHGHEWHFGLDIDIYQLSRLSSWVYCVINDLFGFADIPKAPSPAPQPVTHEVTVGANGMLAFSPSSITALVGDSIEFTFYPKNHSVTQSTFSNPCVPIEQTTGTKGFDSGLYVTAFPNRPPGAQLPFSQPTCRPGRRGSPHVQYYSWRYCTYLDFLWTDRTLRFRYGVRCQCSWDWSQQLWEFPWTR